MNGPTISGRIARTTASRSANAAAPSRGTTEAVSVPAPTRLARMLALAIHVERLIDAGELGDHADAARRLGVTRARVSQIANLASLPVLIQEDILLGRTTVTERQIRSGTLKAKEIVNDGETR